LDKEEPKVESIETLLYFMRGDSRIKDAFNWGISLNYRVSALDILRKKVLEQVPKASLELEESKKSMKATPLKEYIELAVMYEAFLHSVYSLFENISHFVRLVHESKKLPWGFSKQKKRFLEDTDIDMSYSEILKKTDWYDEVNRARDETTHFIAGIVTISDSKGLGYLISNPQNKRAGIQEKIDIDSIEQHVGQTQVNINHFLKEFADHFLRIIDQNSRVTFVCVSPSDTVMGARSYSLKEYLNGEHGICEHNWNCLEVDICRAKKKQMST
jgi:hypothetical protein